MAGGAPLVNIVWPKRTQLELENRKAAQLPAFSVSTLLDGSWQSGFARWMQDQFSLRDAAVNTQRAADEVLFRKAEEGGILLGKDRWMFTKLFTVDDATRKQLAKNVQAVSEFAANHPGKVTFLLAPSASVIYPEKLPAGAPMVDENAMLDDIFAKVGQSADVIDLRGTFTDLKDEYLYFKTDHHWTPNGAYRAYESGLTVCSPASVGLSAAGAAGLYCKSSAPTNAPRRSAASCQSANPPKASSASISSPASALTSRVPRRASRAARSNISPHGGACGRTPAPASRRRGRRPEAGRWGQSSCGYS